MDEDQRRAMIFAGRKRVLLTVGLPLMAVIVIFLLFGMWRLGVNNAQKAAEVVELANIQPATEITLEELLSIPDPDIKITESNQVVINGSLRANKATIGGTLTTTSTASFNGNVALGNAATDDLTISAEVLGATPLVFQGAVDNAYTTSFVISDPTTINKTITFPDESGTVCLSSGNCVGVGGNGDI